MANLPTDIFLDLPDQRSHVVDWGGPVEAPTILLLHGLGLTSNAKVWSFVAPALAKYYRVLALDQRSHGLTGSPADDDFGFEALCSDLHSISENLGISRPIVVGQSWGGDVALEYAARYPDEVAGIAVLDGGFVGINTVMSWPQAEQLAAPLRAGTPLAEIQALAKHFLGDCYSDVIFESVTGSMDVRANGTIVPKLSFESHMKIARAQWEQSADELYAKVKCPALFLPCLPPESYDPMPAQFLAWKRNRMALLGTTMPHAQIEWLTDSIHDVHLQRPAMVAEKVVAFAQSIS